MTIKMENGETWFYYTAGKICISKDGTVEVFATDKDGKPYQKKLEMTSKKVEIGLDED